jgi:hypothetical protein
MSKKKKTQNPQVKSELITDEKINLIFNKQPSSNKVTWGAQPTKK